MQRYASLKGIVGYAAMCIADGKGVLMAESTSPASRRCHHAVISHSLCHSDVIAEIVVAEDSDVIAEIAVAETQRCNR